MSDFATKQLKILGVGWVVVVAVLIFMLFSGKANVPANQTGGGSATS